MTRRMKNPINITELVKLYKSGESENSLSKRYRCSRKAIRSRLLDSGVYVRNISEANIESAKRMTPEARKRRARAANEAIRGNQHSDSHRQKIAAYYEKHPEERQSRYERLLQDELSASSLAFIPQKAFERYNVDFAFPDIKIAVEIFGGVWHGSGRHVDKFNKKSDLLFSKGWSIVVAWCRGGLDSEAIVNYVKNLEVGEPRHYVISGYAKPSKIGKKKLNYKPSLL